MNLMLRVMLRKFNNDVSRIAASVKPKTILDIGCGEGFTTRAIADRIPDASITAIDIDERAVEYAKSNSTRENIKYGISDIFRIRGKYDLVVCNEVLEHLADYEKAIDSLFMAAGHCVLASVPNEPLFRFANLLRLSHVKNLGNPEGHVNHWTSNDLKKIFGSRARNVHITTSTVWNIVLAEK